MTTANKKPVSSNINKVPCPICKKGVALRTEDFPFCSPRCKSIDLGNWASDTYAIADHNPDSHEGYDTDEEQPRIIH